MKNNWLKITSEGEIDITALSLIGASTKRADATKIGFFGSGLKYTIAILLRKKIPFRIYKGDHRVEITTEEVTLREQAFSRIIIDGTPTSLTTEMGVDWEAWMAIREVYSNALDETNCTLTSSPNEPEGIPGWTTIAIFMDDNFTDFCERPHQYFSDFLDAESTLCEVGKITIYKGGEDLIVYKKGIRVHHEKVVCLFNYDIPAADITETRQLKYAWHDKANTIPAAIAKITDVALIKSVLERINYVTEGNGSWENCDYAESWVKAIGSRWIIARGTEHLLKRYLDQPNYILPQKMVDGLRRCFSERLRFAGEGSGGYQYTRCVELTIREAGVIEGALAFLADAKDPVRYEFDVVDFFEKHVLGLAIRAQPATDTTEETKPQILISRRVINEGIRATVSTFIEESAHLDSGASDETRAFQDVLINKIINSMEESTGRFL